MSKTIPESDWKVLRSHKKKALQALCGRILTAVKNVANQAESLGEHAAYLKVYDLVQKQDREIADCFDGMKRSNAFHLLLMWRSRELLSAEQWSEYSQETLSRLDEVMHVMHE